MNRELEDLLKAWDEFNQAPKGPRADRLYELYQARLEQVAGMLNVNRDTLHRSVTRYHRRWARANLPPGFPKELGLQ